MPERERTIPLIQPQTWTERLLAELGKASFRLAFVRTQVEAVLPTHAILADLPAQVGKVAPLGVGAEIAISGCHASGSVIRSWGRHALHLMPFI